ncbi:hypothetical protein [Geoglobus ahangari]
MGQFIDFVVEYTEDPEELGRRILRNITVNRIKAKKPTIIGITGASSEGKSWTALKIADIVNEEFGVDTAEVLDETVVYTPLEYTKKLDRLLFDKELKKVHTLMIDEGRELIKSKLWYDFVRQAIADVNAMHRQIKPLVVLVVSQDIADILRDVRRTLTFYGQCMRPLSGGVHFKLYRLWKDERDLENVKLRKRKLRGHIVKDGRKVVFTVNKFKVKAPRKEIVEKYEKLSFERKSKIIRGKLETLLKQIEKEIGHQFDKVDQLVTYYTEHPELLNIILERKRNKIRVKKEFKNMHDLTATEVKEFEKRLFEKLAEKGLAKVVEG